MSLFGDFPRTDASPKRHVEPRYEFLNRSAWRVCERDRALSERWFAELPEQARSDLYGKFVNKRNDQHLAASFELLIHAILRRLGCSVQVEPDRGTNQARPDFLVGHGDERFYLEVTVSTATGATGPASRSEEMVYDWIDAIDSPNFWLWLRSTGKPRSMPRKRKVVDPFVELMRQSDVDELWRSVEAGDTLMMPSVLIDHEGWVLRGELLPKPPHRRGDGKSPTIGIYSGGAWQSIVPDLIRKVTRKASQKGVHDLDAPLVIAVTSLDGFFDVRHEALRVLFGDFDATRSTGEDSFGIGLSRIADAVWVAKNGGTRSNNLQAVWMFGDASPGNPSIAGRDSRLYFNPFVDVQLPQVLRRVPHALARDGSMQWFDGEDLEHLLGVADIPYEQLRTPAN